MKKWIKRLAVGVVSLIVLLLAVVYGVSEMRLRKTYTVASAARLNVTRDPAQIERGRHLATAVAKCTDCHTADLGGKLFIDGGPFATIYSSNLTAGKGSNLARYTDAQIDAAIRHGVRPDGRGLLIMPSDEYRNLSDEDVSAIIAYLRSLPAVDREQPKSKLGPIGRALFAFGQLPAVPASRIDHETTGPRTAPPAGPTREYGQYLVSVGGCRGCHGPNLAGAPGHGPGEPPAANITPAGPIGRWSEADFVRAIRTGTRPDGSKLKDFMPWKSMASHTEDELHAIWLYLQTVPPCSPRRRRTEQPGTPKRPRRDLLPRAFSRVRFRRISLSRPPTPLRPPRPASSSASSRPRGVRKASRRATNQIKPTKTSPIKAGIKMDGFSPVTRYVCSRLASSPLLIAALLFQPATAALAQSATAPSAMPEPTLAERLDRLAAEFDRNRIDLHVPGAVLAIVRGDEVIFARGFGVAEVENGTPATPDTPFFIGSATKAFTATLVGMLVDDGRMRWDEPVEAYLPEFKLAVRSEAPDDRATLRDVLSHRTGFTRMSFLEVNTGLASGEILRRASSAEPLAPFRQRFLYNNVQYLAAGRPRPRRPAHPGVRS